MARRLLVVLAVLGTSLPSASHAWGLPPALAKKASSSSSMKAPPAAVNNQGAMRELTSAGGHLSVDLTVAPWMEQVRAFDRWMWVDGVGSHHQGGSTSLLDSRPGQARVQVLASLCSSSL